MARIRSVYPRAQVAHLYANASQDYARDPAGALYFRRNAAYSYRDSYALAIRTGWHDAAGNEIILMRRNDYSKTTAKHAGLIRRAFDGHPARIIQTEPRQYCDAPGEAFRLEEVTANDLLRGAPGAAVALRLAVVLECIRHAQACALEAEARNSAERCANDYARAANALADARAVAHAAADKAERRALIARIERDAPAMPAMGERPEYSYDNGVNWAYHCRAVEAWAAAALPFARASRKARKARKAGEDAERARKAAKEAQTHAARVDAAPDNAAQVVTAWTHAYRAWAKAAPMLAKAGDKAGAKDCEKRAKAAAIKADKARPAAAMATARAAVVWINERARYVIAKAAIARRFRKHKARAGFHASVPASVRAAVLAYPDGARDALERAQALKAFADMLRARIAGDSSVSTYARSGGAEAEAIAGLSAIAAGSGALAKRARETLAAVVAALDSGTTAQALATGQALARARACNEARKAWPEAKEYAKPDGVTLENARTAARILPPYLSVLRDAQGIAPRVWASRVMRTESALTVARELSMLAETSSAGMRAIADARAASSAIRQAAESLEAGHCFKARALIERAATGAEAAAHIRSTADRLASVASAENLPAIVRDAARREAESLAEKAASAERDSAIPGDMAGRIAAAVAHASLDLVAHWRATGETAPGMRAVAFRRRGADEIVSTLGAIVSVAAGRRLWALIRSYADAGRSKNWGHNGGPRVGAFHLSRIGADGSAVVGCHSITASEARAFAEYMGWPPFGPVTDADAIEAEAA